MSLFKCRLPRQLAFLPIEKSASGFIRGKIFEKMCFVHALKEKNTHKQISGI